MGQDRQGWGVAELNEIGMRALEEIRRRDGLRSEAAFLRAFEERTGITVSGSTYNRWRTMPERRLPAWSLIAAARAFGYSLDELLAIDARGSRVETLEGIVAKLSRDMAKVMGNQDRLDAHVTDLRKRIEDKDGQHEVRRPST